MRYVTFLFISFSLAFYPLSAEKISTPNLFSTKNKVVPDVPSFFVNYKGNALKCYPIRYIDNHLGGRQIEYQCIKKDIDIAHEKTNAFIDNGKVTGIDETKKMKEEIKYKKNIGTMYTVKIAERNAYNPKKASFIAKRELDNDIFFRYIHWLLPARLYVSARPQYSGSEKKQSMELKDGGSRGGFFYYHEFDNGFDLIFQHEASIDWGDVSSFINLSSNSESSRRLQYISVSKNHIGILGGKYWSPYYDIAGMTDHFMAYGSAASGAYNDTGDGGASGTGRSNRAVQAHIERDNVFSARLQYQPAHSPNKDINSDYSYGVAGSFVYKGWQNTRVGASVAYGKFKQITPQMEAIGIEGSDLSCIVGISYLWKNLTANAVLSYTKNHMNDDQGIYFDGVGAELYMRYNISNSIRLVAGGNWLYPKDSNYKGKYSIRKPILSVQYTFGKQNYDDLFYVEVTFPKGHTANGESIGTKVAVGLRYLFNFW